MSYQVAAQLVAVVKIVVSSLFLVFFGFFALIVTAKRDAILTTIEKNPKEYAVLKELLEASTLEQWSIFLVPTFYFITNLGLGVFLYQSAKTLNHKRLRLWCTITTTLMCVGLVFFFAEILKTGAFVDVPILILYLLNFAFTLFSLYVTYALIKDIKAGVAHPVPYNNGFYKL